MKPATIDLDGWIDQNGVKYVGKAVLQAFGKYRCAVLINGAITYIDTRIIVAEGSRTYYGSRVPLPGEREDQNNGL